MGRSRGGNPKAACPRGLIEPKVEGGENVWVNMPESLSWTTTKA